MNSITKNQYQVNKTIRFGLSVNEHKTINSHSLLADSISSSLQNIKSTIQKTGQMEDKELINKISKLFSDIKEFSFLWGKIYGRKGQIAITKDYYRIISKKARFDRDDKQSSQLIKLSSLSSKYQERERFSYIIDYWKDILQRQEQFISRFEPLLVQYKIALENQDKAHKKPDLVNFSKILLSLFTLVNEVLEPLKNYSICFPGIDKLEPGKRNEDLIKFATGYNFKKLYADIAEIKDYLNSNGGYTHFGRVTLNRYTAEQKPHNFKAKINKIISELRIKDLVNNLRDKTEKEIRAYIEEFDKKEIFYSESASVIEKVQCFKYRSIPVLAKQGLVSLLSSEMKIEEDKIQKILDDIGKPHSIGQDYSNADNESKKCFDLNKYPLKIAFDYAWENLAKSFYGSKEKFPRKQCIDFLSDVFDCNIEKNTNFKLYAGLLNIKENLSTLEHDNNRPNSPEHYAYKIEKTFKELERLSLSKENFKHKNIILEYLDKNLTNLSNKDNRNFREYEKAKKQLGLFRGRLKNNISEYFKLTKEFKKIASDFGKKFADLRDKFKEENEFNKISHFGIVLKDNNCDRYVLLNPLWKNNEAVNEQDRKDAVAAVIDSISDSGEYTAYLVKSLTSKALLKIIKNKGTYPNFHNDNASGFDSEKAKKEWESYQNNESFLNYLKGCLENSIMAKEQNWAEFGWDFVECNTYDDICREIDKKSYRLQTEKISEVAISQMVENGCLLFPVINQDITSKTRQLKNRFSKDWEAIFDNENDYRLHPEFRISYRTPTEGYPVEKRFGRLQFIAHFNCEIIPSNTDFMNKREQLALFNEQEKLLKEIEKFNKVIADKLKDDYVVIGIDRGIKQLATLCVLDKYGKIKGDFKVYRKDFDSVAKKWKHEDCETRHILDLSNLRVETTVDGKKVLVDQSLTKVKKNRNSPDMIADQENRQKIKLKQLSYIRKLQYEMQTNEGKVLALAGLDETEFVAGLKGLISPYGEGKAYSDLPVEKLRIMIMELKAVNEKSNNRAEKNKIIELDHADELKRGIVANMIGVVNYILEMFEYKAYISMENLTRAYGGAKDGLNGRYIPSTNQDNDVDFKEQQNLMLAGLGTYQFFEMQLLKKLFKIQKQNDIYHFVPAFRSVDNYENIKKLSEYKENEKASGTGIYVAKPFGIVHFIDPKLTSSKCPVCSRGGRKNINRNFNKNNILKCNECGFTSVWDKEQNENFKDNKAIFNDKKIEEFVSTNNQQIKKKRKTDCNLQYIKNGDDNGAYHIALKTVKNIKDK